MRATVLAIALVALAPLVAAQQDSAVPSAPTACEPGAGVPPDETNCPPGTGVSGDTQPRVTEDEPVPQEAVGPYDMARVGVIVGALVILAALVGVAWWRTREGGD